MRIVLVSPNYAIRDKFGDPSDPPLGVASIAAFLEREGYFVSVIDANAEDLAIEEVYSRLVESRPDVVGVSCNFSPLHHPTLAIARMVKERFGLPVIVGGNHASALADFMLESSPYIDFIVRGEGEVVLPPLLKALQCGTPLTEVRGITFRTGSLIQSTPDAGLVSDLDDLPLPAYHLLPMDRYKRYNIVASRGCPHNCSYCASDVIFRKKVRYRKPVLVVDEIEHLMEKYGKKQIWFSDDTFITKPDYTHSLLDELMKRELRIAWSCLTRVDRVTEELLERMKASGCSYISYGIEAGNPEVLDQIGKKITVVEILKALELTHRIGIRQFGFFIVGFPGENWARIMDSYRLIYRSCLDGAAFNILIPLPGTRLMNELLKKDLIRLDEIKWDYLFARTPDEAYESYSADLAGRWCEMSGRELIEACHIGHRLPEIFAHVREK